jgi:hypothetical protein
MEIDESDAQLSNAELPIRASLESDRNLTLERRVSRKKHLSPKNSTDDGTRIDESDEHPSNGDV